MVRLYRAIATGSRHPAFAEAGFVQKKTQNNQAGHVAFAPGPKRQIPDLRREDPGFFLTPKTVHSEKRKGRFSSIIHK
ncbi:MAG: hypothetical protein D6714_15005, partial [Bacteroidetes bacterium]